MAIEKGNTFYVPADYLGGDQGRKVTIEWSQMMKSRSEDYYLSKYTNKTSNNGGETGIIFVQASKLAEFKNKKIDGDEFTFKIDDSFQYGQKKDGTDRFLVYHDKNNKPYQHRFVENTISSLGGKASDFVSSLGFSDVVKVEDVARHFVAHESPEHVAVKLLKMASADYWNDPIFASIRRERANPPLNPNAITPKQSVDKITLNDQQSALAGDEAPKFTTWDGFYSDPVFAKVTGRRERLPPGQQREFWKYEVDKSVSVASLFPSLASSAFGAVSFRQSAIEFWSKPIGNERAGLYFRTEVEFNGLLDDVFRTFKEILGDAAKPSLRLSAYLGLTPLPDQSFILDGLTLSGSLLGLRTPLPPVLELVTILSVGVKLNIGTRSQLPITNVPSITDTRTPPAVEFELFGDLHIDVPGLTGLLKLEYKATVDDEFIRLVGIIPGNEKWSNALGAESLHLDEVKFTATLPLSSSTKKAPKTDSGVLQRREEETSRHPDPQSVLSLSVTARWKGSGGTSIDLEGKVFKGRPDTDFKPELSYLQGTMQKVTWSDIKQLFSDVHGEPLENTEHSITCETLTVRISQAQFLLTGSLKINDRPLADASIAITRSGIAITAKVQEWEVDGGLVTVKNASLTLLVGKPSKADTASPQPEGGPPSKRLESDTTSSLKKQGWSGGLEVSGWVVINQYAATQGRKAIEIEVTFAIGKSFATNKQSKEWFWVLCGHMESDISLSQFISAIDEGADIDFKLKGISLIASNANDPACSIKTNGYAIRKGIFICAKLEKVPLLKVGETVKEPAAGDNTYLSIGWEKGSTFPSVSIFLPESLKIELGPRFRSKRFQLQLGLSPKAGVAFSFVGNFGVKVDENGDWLEFALKMTVDAVGADGELSFNGKINDPFGLSKQLTIGPRLAIGMKFNWTQLAATGMPIGAGFEGGFYIGESERDPYSMVLYVCEDPRDMLIKVTAPYMNYFKLIQLVAAAMNCEIPITDIEVFSFHDVLIYASLGATFGGENYPRGFSLKGMIKICGVEAAMDCSLTAEGFHLKAWLQTFKLGPLKVGGDVQIPGKQGTFALLEMDLSPKKQAFFLNGFVEIFSLRADVDIHVQLMPTPIFYFNFELRWSDLLKIKAKAEMVKKDNMKNPEAADWTVSADFEQNIIQEIAKSLQTALEAVHKAVQKKLDGAKATVAEAEKKYKAAIEEAQRSLDAKRTELKKENDELDRRLDELERKTVKGKAEYQANVASAKINETKSVQDARDAKDRKLEEHRGDIQNKETNVRDKESSARNESNNAVSDREQKKQAFMSTFGDAEADLERARSDVRRANDWVKLLDREIDGLENRLRGLNFFQRVIALDLNFQIAELSLQLGCSKVGLTVAEGALTVVLDVMQSTLFRELKEAWYRANEVIETVKRKVELAINQARDQLNNAKKLLEALELTLAGDFEKAEREAKGMVGEAQKLYEDYSKQQDLESEKLGLQMNVLKNSALSTAVATAEGTLELVKNNNMAFKAAQAGLDAVKDVEDVVYHALDGLLKAAANLCDIRVIKLDGTITGNAADQKAFTIHMEGTLVGQEFNFDVYYTPGQTTDFLEQLAKRAVEHLRLTK
ncbi:hypothetical protein MMC22_004163 [Lobaria immixta]|nr:hypothetical protein [Lobaria immixta]